MKKKILTMALSAALTASLIPAGALASTEGMPAEQDTAEVLSDEETSAFPGEQGDESLESADDDDEFAIEELSVEEYEISDPDALVLEGMPEEEISGDEEMAAEEEPADEAVDILALAAHDAIGSYEDLKSAVNGQTGTIAVTLSESFASEGVEHISLASGAEVTIDLNGCTITADDLGGGALFTVPENTSLTITDGQAEPAVKGNGASVDAAAAGQLAELAGSIESGISLTYYVTESTVTDSAFGRTQETRYSYSVSSNGMICTTGQDHALFSVTGGTLNIDSGFFYGEAESSGNRAIDASSGTVNLSGGYICGFDEAYRSGHGEASDGGAVRVTDSAVLNISDAAVLAANKAATGGAIDVANGGTLNMAGGVISGNEATEDIGTSEWNADYGGGGIHAYGSGTVVNISGGYLTNNVSDCMGYFDGGGGILLNGATLHFNGGYITGNKAASSGGGIRTAFAANSGQRGSFVYITGGYLCANYAGGAEGGGFCLDNGSYAEITAASAIYINDNETNTSVHWGGGGVFCANGATLYMNDAMITDNAAGGFGGGVAGCSTGRIAIADDAGAAIYGNSAEGQHTSGEGSTKHDDTEYALNDKVFMENGYQDYYCALESMVSGMMLGGGSANWHGSADGEVIDSIGIGEFLWASYIMGLTAYPDNAAIVSAQQAAKVYVNGNSSYTHGGGVLSNGYLFMGTVINYEIGDALQVNADKQLLDQYGAYAGIEEGQFNFEITDENGEEVSTGTTQSDGSIFFARRLSFNEAGTFTFFIKETAPAEPGFIIDSAVYTLVVTVRASEEEVEVAGVPLDFVYYNITHVTLTKSGSVDPLLDQDVTSSEDTVTSITIPSPAFVNQEAEKTSISVQKTWQDESGAGIDWPADIDAITVYLYQNGEIYKEAVTLTESSPGYTWTDLPICGTDASGEIVTYTYEVTEDALEGYETEITEEDGSFTIVNAHIPETIDIEGSKTWDDHNDQDGKRPSSVTISLYADGVPALDENGEAISAIVTGEDWTYSFTNLPKNEDGRELVYTVIETEVDDYTAVYDGYDITNSYTPGKTALDVRKFWDDADDQDEIRPEKITVVLMKNGEETDQTLTLDKSNDWSGSFTDLDEYTDGILNEYSVAEIAVKGYDCEIVAVEDTTTVHITNSHTPDREDKEDQDKEEKKPGSKTPPTTDNPSSANPTSATGVKTGDPNHPGLWIALLAAAGVIAVVSMTIQTRRTRQRRR